MTPRDGTALSPLGTNVAAPLDLLELSRLLRSTPIALQELLSAVPFAATVWHPRPGAWCVKEIVGHLIEEDKVDFVDRIRVMLDREEPVLTVTDQDEAVRIRQDCSKRLIGLLEEFRAVRATSADFISQLTPEDLNRRGRHPHIGDVCVANLLYEWVYHDLNHLKQIATNVQSLLWAQLGNMQQFYQHQKPTSPGSV